MSSAGFTQTVTYSDIILCDPFATGSTCNNGGSTTAHNLLSTTHLDTVPESPPVRGDLITAQNVTSPSGVTPAWAALPIGTNGQVLTSTGVDAVWGTLTAGTNITITSVGGNTTINSTGGGGSGCTLPSHDTAVLSEHPAGTCYDSLDWTWDDTNFVNLQGDGTNSVSGTNTLAFSYGKGNTQAFATRSLAFGDTNTVTCDSNTVGNGTCSNLYQIGRSQGITATGASSRGSFIFQIG
jgi:hypothetical protein